MNRILATLATGATLSLAASGAIASPLVVLFDNFTYSGGVTAPDGTRYPIGTGGFFNENIITRPDARDGLVSVRNAANTAPQNYGADFALISTAWYFTAVSPFVTNGYNNPNNRNYGFFQYYDVDGFNSGVTISGGWQPGNTVFKLQLTGGNGDDGNLARLWDAPVTPDGVAGDTAGYFTAFALDLTATFATPATLNATTGWYEQWDVMPTSVTGTITGTFINDSTTRPDANGTYTFAFTISGPGSWAADNSAYFRSGQDDIVPRSRWAAPDGGPVPVPEPASLALLGLGLAGLALARRRRAL